MRGVARAACAEWRLLSRERGFWLLLAMLAALVLYGAQVGSRWAQQQHATIAEATEHERQAHAALREAIANERDAGTGLASRPGWAPLFRYAILPPPPLMALAIGQSDLQASVIQVGIDRSPRSLTRGEEIQNPHNLLAGRFDVAFVVVYIVPLALLLTGAGAVTHERETGTLPLAVASAGSVSAIAVGKALARGILVLAVTCATVLLALPLSGAGVQDPVTIARIALWLVIACAYGAFWWGVALLIDVTAGRGTTKAIAAIVVWAVVVLIVPGLPQVAGQMIHPSPVRTEEVLQAREAWRQLAPQGDRLLTILHHDRPDLAPAGGHDSRRDPVAAHYAVHLELERQLRPVLDAHEAQRARQRALVTRLAYLSPAALAHDALATVAGTGWNRYEAFVHDAERLHHEWRNLLLPMIFRGERLDSAYEELLPRFTSRGIPPATAGTMAGPLAGILLPAIAAVALACRALGRFSAFINEA